MHAVCFPDDVSVTYRCYLPERPFRELLVSTQHSPKGDFVCGISSAYIWYDIYLLQLGLHLVSAVGRLVQK